jgi:hypothetical protein
METNKQAMLTVSKSSRMRPFGGYGLQQYGRYGHQLCIKLLKSLILPRTSMKLGYWLECHVPHPKLASQSSTVRIAPTKCNEPVESVEFTYIFPKHLTLCIANRERRFK